MYMYVIIIFHFLHSIVSAKAVCVLLSLLTMELLLFLN